MRNSYAVLRNIKSERMMAPGPNGQTDVVVGEDYIISVNIRLTLEQLASFVAAERKNDDLRGELKQVTQSANLLVSDIERALHKIIEYGNLRLEGQKEIQPMGIK